MLQITAKLKFFSAILNFVKDNHLLKLDPSLQTNNWRKELPTTKAGKNLVKFLLKNNEWKEYPEIVADR